ncbi:hypothetical protein ACJIZ3_006396 [Penstemon smallii]|uniref:Uncharacterized protein n=1 Tax=Penstemon smallii TaxID=265156 RepID=A0ABD3S7K1_9LAMI
MLFTLKNNNTINTIHYSFCFFFICHFGKIIFIYFYLSF